MPIVSKYSNETIESLVNELLLTLEKRNANVELSLMVLGNTVTHLMNQKIPAAHRSEFCQSFCQALANSISETHK